jgi:steroid 5-alpha reductase family enzyme
MDRAEKSALIAIPITLLFAAIVAYAGSQGSYVILGFPLFTICVALAFIIQWIAFIPAYINRTERFFDLTGSITYLSVMIFAVLANPVVDPRGILILAIVVVWAIRLGSFLFRRVRAEGFDRRFDEIKLSFARFLMTWTLQGLWVSITLAAALAAVTSKSKLPLGIFAFVGFLVWLLGFVIEVIADRQKSQFRAAPENAGKFINVGLWSWSRHPNYFGEIILWIGVAIITLPILRGWQWLTLISPLFVIILLTRISGIPMLEVRADAKWGGQPAYEDYKNRTSVLILKPPSAPK